MATNFVIFNLLLASSVSANQWQCAELSGRSLRQSVPATQIQRLPENKTYSGQWTDGCQSLLQDFTIQSAQFDMMNYNGRDIRKVRGLFGESHNQIGFAGECDAWFGSHPAQCCIANQKPGIGTSKYVDVAIDGWVCFYE